MPHRVAAIRACALACRFAFAVLLLVATGLHALNIGERYDFLCSDGQDVYNAELTAEDEKNYYVRLSPVMAQVPIEKQFVVSTASKSQAKAVKPQPAGPRFELALGAGADFSLGRLTVLARVAPAAAVTGTFWWRPNWGFFGRLAADEFRAAPAYLRALQANSGAWYQLPWTFARISALFGVGGGLAYLSAQTTAFSETAVVISALAVLRLQYAWNTRWIFFLEPAATYLYDRETLIVIPGLQAGAGYRW